MRTYRGALLLILFLASLSGNNLLQPVGRGPQSDSPHAITRDTYADVTTIPCRFVDERGFRWMLKQTDESESPFWRTGFPLNGDPALALPEQEPAGLILPHHNVATPLIGRILSEAASRCEGKMPETIILIGPNHNREGVSRIQTSVLDWATPEGTMSCAVDWASELIGIYGPTENPSLMEREHSLSMLVPWLKNHFPDASILPVLIHGNFEIAQCAALSDTLTDFASRRKTLIIASIDFSHGLSTPEALLQDEKTWFLIKAGDAAGILRLGNENLDAPPTLAILMMTMRMLTNAPAQLVGHAEASAFLGHPVKETTSYLSVVWPATVH